MSHAPQAPVVQPVVPQETVLVRTVLPVNPAEHVPFSEATGLVAEGHSSVQVAPDSVTVPLVQVASALPEKPDVVLVADPVLLWVSAPKE